MSGYKTYRFRDKDPVIDLVRTCVQIFAGLRGVKFGRAMTLLERDSGVKAATMRNWFFGATVSPKFSTLAAVVYATGRDIHVGNKTVRTKPRFRVVRGGTA